MLDITIKDFLDTIFPDPGESDQVVITHPAPEDEGFWNYAATTRRLRSITPGDKAWYYGVCTVRPQPDGKVKRTRDALVEAWVVVLDDVGTKAAVPPVAPSYVLESSEGNYQYGYLITPTDDLLYYEACQRGLGIAGYHDPGASGAYRVVRLPGSLHHSGYIATLRKWHPDRCWELADLMQSFGVEPVAKGANVELGHDSVALEDVEDELYDWFRDTGLLTGTDSGEFIGVLCPWRDTHSDGRGEAGYSPFGYGSLEDRAFNCFHGHCEQRSVHDLIEYARLMGGPDMRTKIPGYDFPQVYGVALPDARLTKDGELSAKQIMTRANVEYLLNEWRLVCRYDLMADRIVFVHRGETISGRSPQFNELRNMLLDELTRLNIGNHARLDDILRVIAEHDAYHPVEEWLQGLSWDGEDHVGALASTITTPSTLWPVHLRNWLIQAVEGACGWRTQGGRALPYVLTFSGGQGLGKSTWFANLAPPVDGCYRGDASLHLDRSSGKDDQLSVLSHFIVELAELDSTFSKSHVGALKNFISRRVDEIRAPYAKEATTRARCTVFCASVNETEFLSDDTGSRRFPVVEVQAVQWGHGVSLEGVWAQAYALWARGTGFELTQEQAAIRDKENEEFQVHHYNSMVLEEFFDDRRMSSPVTSWIPLGLQSIAQVAGVSAKDMKHPAAMKAFSSAVRKRFGPHRKLWGQKRRWLVPVTLQECEVFGITKPVNSDVKVS